MRGAHRQHSPMLWRKFNRSNSNGDAGNYALSTTPASVRNADNGLCPMLPPSWRAAVTLVPCCRTRPSSAGLQLRWSVGERNNSSSTTPVQVLTSSSPSTPLTNVLVLALTHDHTCAIRSGTASTVGETMDMVSSERQCRPHYSRRQAKTLPHRRRRRWHS